MVKATYDRTARRNSVHDDARNGSVVAESNARIDVAPGIDTVRYDAITASTVCQRNRRVNPAFCLGETEPRLALGMGQLLDPLRRRSIVATGTFCAEYCEIHRDWSWESL
jgi:hypothetical protein